VQSSKADEDTLGGKYIIKGSVSTMNKSFDQALNDDDVETKLHGRFLPLK
jgi:hypothetical protein